MSKTTKIKDNVYQRDQLNIGDLFKHPSSDRTFKVISNNGHADQPGRQYICVDVDEPDRILWSQANSQCIFVGGEDTMDKRIKLGDKYIVPMDGSGPKYVSEIVARTKDRVLFYSEVAARQKAGHGANGHEFIEGSNKGGNSGHWFIENEDISSLEQVQPSTFDTFIKSLETGSGKCVGIVCSECPFKENRPQCQAVVDIEQISPEAAKILRTEMIAKIYEYIKKDPARKQAIADSQKHWQINTEEITAALYHLNKTDVSAKGCALCATYQKTESTCLECPLSASGNGCNNDGSIWRMSVEARADAIKAVSEYQRVAGNMRGLLAGLK